MKNTEQYYQYFNVGLLVANLARAKDPAKAYNLAYDISASLLLTDKNGKIYVPKNWLNTYNRYRRWLAYWRDNSDVFQWNGKGILNGKNKWMLGDGAEIVVI